MRTRKQAWRSARKNWVLLLPRYYCLRVRMASIGGAAAAVLGAATHLRAMRLLAFAVDSSTIVGLVADLHALRELDCNSSDGDAVACLAGIAAVQPRQLTFSRCRFGSGVPAAASGAVACPGGVTCEDDSLWSV